MQSEWDCWCAWMRELEHRTATLTQAERDWRLWLVVALAYGMQR